MPAGAQIIRDYSRSTGELTYGVIVQADFSYIDPLAIQLSGTIELVKTLKADVVGLAFLVELLFLKGRERLGGQFKHSVIQY